jgi:hypothetical protein
VRNAEPADQVSRVTVCAVVALFAATTYSFLLPGSIREAAKTAPSLVRVICSPVVSAGCSLRSLPSAAMVR